MKSRLPKILMAASLCLAAGCYDLPAPYHPQQQMSRPADHIYRPVERWADIVNDVWEEEIAAGEVTTEEVLYIIWCESRGNPNARNSDNPHVIGLFQIDKRWMTDLTANSRLWGKIGERLLDINLANLTPGAAHMIADWALTEPEHNAAAAKIISDDSVEHGQPRWSNWECQPQ